MSERYVIRCWYASTLAPEFDKVVERAVGRQSSFGGMDIRDGRRLLGWSLHSKVDADELRKRLASCPEVTVE